MTYHGTGINDSTTITAKAKDAIESGAFLAATLTEEGVAISKASEVPMGIMIPETDGIAAGEDVTIQVKDIGLAMVGEAVKPGDLLAADEGGKLKKATDGAFILAVALEEATAADQVVSVQIIKAGYKGAAGGGGGGGAKTMSELTDVEGAATDGQVLVYNGSDSKWKPTTLSIPKKLADLSDVEGTDSASSDQVLKYQDSKWKPGKDKTGDV